MSKSEYSANLALQTQHRGRQVAVNRQFSWLSRLILRICGF